MPELFSRAPTAFCRLKDDMCNHASGLWLPQKNMIIMDSTEGVLHVNYTFSTNILFKGDILSSLSDSKCNCVLLLEYIYIL